MTGVSVNSNSHSFNIKAISVCLMITSSSFTVIVTEAEKTNCMLSCIVFYVKCTSIILAIMTASSGLVINSSIDLIRNDDM